MNWKAFIFYFAKFMLFVQAFGFLVGILVALNYPEEIKAAPELYKLTSLFSSILIVIIVRYFIGPFELPKTEGEK